MKDFLSINEAAELANKSVQTIRRMIKAKKVKYRRKKTPQGFNYLIDRKDLLEYCGIEDKEYEKAQKSYEKLEKDLQDKTKEVEQEKRDLVISKELALFEDKIDSFNSTIQKLVEQNQRDKENFFHLIKTFQDRVNLLENNVKVLETSQNKKWFSFWRK